jgi:hypothetical protein
MNRRRSSRVIMAMALVALVALTATATAIAGHGGAHKPPVTVTVTGTVTGTGGSGNQAWSMPLAAARVACPQLKAATSSDASGSYTLCLEVPHGPYSYYDCIALRCSHRFYHAAKRPLSAENPQVQDFTLRVRGTELKVIVRSSCKAVKNARVYVFGQVGLTGRDGVVVFDSLELKPLTLYQCTVEKAGCGAKTSSFWSRPGGEQTIWVSIRKK